jgi:hypothetical protein
MAAALPRHPHTVLLARTNYPRSWHRSASGGLQYDSTAALPESYFLSGGLFTYRVM